MIVWVFVTKNNVISCEHWKSLIGFFQPADGQCTATGGGSEELHNSTLQIAVKNFAHFLWKFVEK